MEDPNRAHHRTDRLAPRRRFDEVECTISHLLRFPHPALGGRRYGEALLQGIAGRGIRPARSGVVEIGGGAGHVAEAAWRGDAGPFSLAGLLVVHPIVGPGVNTHFTDAVAYRSNIAGISHS